jgi:hypothetical protein
MIDIPLLFTAALNHRGCVLRRQDRRDAEVCGRQEDAELAAL